MSYLAQLEAKKAKDDAYWQGVGDRIFARAERTEAARRKIKAQQHAATVSKPTVSATARWKAAVAEAKASGMPAAKAVQHVNRANPGLRERMLAEANG